MAVLAYEARTQRSEGQAGILVCCTFALHTKKHFTLWRNESYHEHVPSRCAAIFCTDALLGAPCLLLMVGCLQKMLIQMI